MLKELRNLILVHIINIGLFFLQSNQKSGRVLAVSKKNLHLCTAFRKDGRVVECGGLENR